MLQSICAPVPILHLTLDIVDRQTEKNINKHFIRKAINKKVHILSICPKGGRSPDSPNDKDSKICENRGSTAYDITLFLRLYR